MYDITMAQAASYLDRNSASPLYYQLKEYIKEFERKNGIINIEQSVSEK